MPGGIDTDIESIVKEFKSELLLNAKDMSRKYNFDFMQVVPSSGPRFNWLGNMKPALSYTSTLSKLTK